MVAVCSGLDVHLDEITALNAVSRFPAVRDPVGVTRGAAEDCRASGKPIGPLLHRWLEKQLEIDARNGADSARERGHRALKTLMGEVG